MTKFVVVTTLTPTNFNKPVCYVVEANSDKDARAITKDQLRDLGAYEQYVYEVKPYVEPPPGRILGTTSIPSV